MVSRRTLLAALAAGAAAGCATADQPAVRKPPPTGGVLTPFGTITGGWQGAASVLPAPAPPARPAVRAMLRQPVGIAARGDVVMIADAGNATLWRYERARDAITAIAPFAGRPADHAVSMALDTDFSTWIAQPGEHGVVQVDAAGRVLRRLRDDVNAPRPVGVALHPERGEVLVADAASAQVVAFDRLGKAFRFHRAGRTPLQSVSAMAWGPLGLYVLDRLAQQVVVLGPRGEVVALAGDEHLVQPRALAVDRAGRVFVSDEVDQRIKVFRGPDLIAEHGGPQFGRIEAMAFDSNFLYVADSVNARVHLMLVAPTSLEPRPAAP